MIIISLLLLVHCVLCTVSSDGFLRDEFRSNEDDLDTTDALNERWLGDCPCRVNRSRTLHQRKTRTTRSGLRLVAQSGNAWEGRVEVFYNGSWGTVCDDGFDVIDARVVCRMLGYNTEFPTVHLRSFYGNGDGSIYLDNVRCNGRESSIIHCGHNGFGVHDCVHEEDVGVNCTASALDTKLFRVVSLRSSSEGRVESFVNGSWATVCDAGFDVSHARSICHSLGFSGRTPIVHKGAHYGPGSGNIQDLKGTLCSGKDNIYNCGTAGNCSHSNDVGVDCWPNSTIAGDVVRLASSTNVSEGRVEVFINGEWGSVCDVEFDVADARVICRMLGFANNHPTVHPGAYYGAGTGNIWLENVTCKGSESDILQCGYSGFGLHNCNHAQDVGINCAIIASVRLANGDNSWEGRVDVWDRETWATVCRNGFDLKDARVICRMLGFNEDQQSLYNYSQNGQNAEVMWLYSLGCNGSEHNIFQCPRTELLPLDCNPSDGVGVRCRTTANTIETTTSAAEVTTSHGHHDITCTESRMEFSIPLSSPHTSETATLSDPNCQINVTRTHVRGGVDLNSCGTTVQFQNDSVIFRNAIIFSAPESSSLGSSGSNGSVSQYQDIIPIQCVYNRIATVHLSYMPVVRRVLFTESGVGQFSFNIQQFWDASFTNMVSDRAYPLRMELDADVFIQLSVGSEGQPVAGHKEIGMEVQQCLVSPSSSVIEAQLHYYPLIQDGCPASSDVHIIPNTNASDSTVMRFRFRAVNFFDPSSSSSSSLVFVHCRMGLCLTGSCKPSAWSCLTPPARRVRRDVDQSKRAAHQLSTGPFLIMADEASTSSSSTTATVMAVVSTSVATVAIVIAAIALIALRRRRTTERN